MATRKKTIQQWTADALKAPAPKRGRPVTTGTTPAKDRKAKERATLADDGGSRLNLNLTPQGREDLAAIRAENPGLSKTEAVHAALYAYRRNL